MGKVKKENHNIISTILLGFFANTITIGSFCYQNYQNKEEAINSVKLDNIHNFAVATLLKKEFEQKGTEGRMSFVSYRTDNYYRYIAYIEDEVKGKYDKIADKIIERLKDIDNPPQTFRDVLINTILMLNASNEQIEGVRMLNKSCLGFSEAALIENCRSSTDEINKSLLNSIKTIEAFLKITSGLRKKSTIHP